MSDVESAASPRDEESSQEAVDSAREESHSYHKRGRPVGKVDSTKRHRRTAQEISNDKISVASMKLESLKEREALHLLNKHHQERSLPLSQFPLSW